MPNPAISPPAPITRPAEPWPLEELVRAQCLACEGLSVEEIARVIGRTSDEVRLRLEPEPSPRRQATANIGYPHLKRRR